MTTITDNNQTTTNDKQQNRYLLSENSFELLRQAQQVIRDQTEMTPSLHKLINRLVTKETVDLLTKEMIEILQ